MPVFGKPSHTIAVERPGGDVSNLYDAAVSYLTRDDGLVVDELVADCAVNSITSND